MLTIRNTLLTTLIIALFNLAACGFQLKGQVDLPAGIEPIAITGVQNNSQLEIELRNIMTAAGITLNNTVSEANTRLNIISESTDRRTAALGERARIIEYQLLQQVTFELLDNNNRVLLGPVDLTERKFMPNDPNKVISSADEELRLRREMSQNLAARIARQLQSVTLDSPANTTPINTTPINTTTEN